MSPIAPPQHTADPILRALITWATQALSLFLVGLVMPGVKVERLRDALVFVLFASILNAVFWHFFGRASFGAVLLAAGSGSILGNAILFYVASKFVKGVQLSGCITAFFLALFVTVLAWTMRTIIPF